jgi:hypothetical protein
MAIDHGIGRQDRRLDLQKTPSIKEPTHSSQELRAAVPDTLRRLREAVESPAAG